MKEKGVMLRVTVLVSLKCFCFVRKLKYTEKLMCSCQLLQRKLVFLTEAITSDSYICKFNIKNTTKENA